MTLTPQEQLRGSLALGVLEDRNTPHHLRSLGIPQQADAIETLMEIVRRLAEPDGAAPSSERANGRSKSGGGAAYKEV